MLFLIFIFISIFFLFKKKLNLKELHVMNVVCCWWGKFIYCWTFLTQEVNTQIMKMTQTSEWVQEDLPFTQPLGNWGTNPELFPSHCFHFPWAQHELSQERVSPLRTKDLSWEETETFPQAFDLIRWNQVSDFHPWLEKERHRAQNFTTLLLLLFFQFCPVNTSHLQIHTLCRWPADQCLVPAFTSTVLVVGGLFLEVSETRLPQQATKSLLKSEHC